MAQRLLDAAGAAALAVAVSLAVHVAIHCPVQPVGPPPTRPPAASAAARFPPNNLLQNLEKLGEGQLNAPEDVYVDAGGEVYTGTRDGWVRRMRGNGSWERWGLVGGLGLLGIAPSADGAMLVCDADKASDGTVYFSDASTRFNFDNWFQDFLEYRFTGRLLKYDPRTGKASVVLDGLGFANGVALPPDEAFVVVCETMKFRCLRVWLKGEKAGEAEIFVDNLPGNPDNIRLGSDGHFWIALLQVRSPWLDLISRWSLTRRVIASFPSLVERTKATLKGAVVAQVSLNGEIMRVLGDSEGKVINLVTSVTESNGDLFLGSLATNFIGKLSLAKVPQEQEDAVSSFRCLRVWLKGEKAGQAEIFVDNLPGNPDNIRLGSDGEVSMAGPDLPLELDQEGHRFVPIAHREDQGDLVAQVSLNGEIMRVLGDSEGKMIDHFTSVTEFNGDLFLGSLATNFIGKISLAKVPHEQEYAVPS
uniref:Strictosidine synthase conserved region domain-containing protein n=1 Tax=Oryza punctata TaxID=4537 RepID=A0A0E0LN94_ORYPU